MRHAAMMGLALVCLGQTVSNAAGVEDSIVRISSSIRLPHIVTPWTRQKPLDVSGTGVVIDGKKILTNAHVVLYASEITIQGADGGERFDAKVESIAPEVDLAVLTLSDESFFEKHPPVSRRDKPPTPGTPVSLYGFPVGGRDLSTTQGVVSRMEYAAYSGRTAGMRIQVDAAVNPGNSGGPAMVRDEMVGLTFGQLAEAENVGYIIPNEEIDIFLADVTDGKYDGKARYVGKLQPLENDALRARFGIPKSVHGVLVRSAEAGSSLQLNDVIVKVGDQEIDNEGSIRGPEGRAPFFAEAIRLARTGKVPVSVLRDGKTLELELPMETGDSRLIRSFVGQPFEFFVHGPLVFGPVMQDSLALYLRANPTLMFGSGPIATRRNENRNFEDEELVIVTSPMFPHKITKGYGEPFGQILDQVNGTKVKNLAHLVEILATNQDEYLTFEFLGDASEMLVFNRKAMNDATEEIMADNGITKRGSDSVLPIWNKHASAGK